MKVCGPCRFFCAFERWLVFPRSLNRGNRDSCESRCLRKKASMEPRSLNRGNCPGPMCRDLQRIRPRFRAPCQPQRAREHAVFRFERLNRPVFQGEHRLRAPPGLCAELPCSRCPIVLVTFKRRRRASSRPAPAQWRRLPRLLFPMRGRD